MKAGRVELTWKTYVTRVRVQLHTHKATRVSKCLAMAQPSVEQQPLPRCDAQRSRLSSEPGLALWEGPPLLLRAKFLHLGSRGQEAGMGSVNPEQ